MCKATELRPGDRLGFNFNGEVVAVASVAGGKRIKIKVTLDDQRRLEFLDAGVVEFLCPPSRTFVRYRDDDDDDEVEPVPVPPPISDFVA